MVQYDKKVLNKLLDTYENSLLSIGKNKRTVNIELRFTKTVLPEYFDESSFVYENIHIQLRNMEEKGLIKIIWKGKKVDYVIQKVQLNMEMLTEAYAFVHRKPKCNLVEENMTFLEEYCYAYRLNNNMTDNKLKEIIKDFECDYSRVEDKYFSVIESKNPVGTTTLKCVLSLSSTILLSSS